MKNKICPRCGSVMESDAPEGLCPRCLVEAGFETEPRRPAESGRAEPLSCDEVARYFPEMEIRALLGAGGMGAVYQAYQPQLDRLVAIKVLDRKARDPAFVERFTQEARTLARLNHPNIVAVHDFGERDGLFFLIMELVDGVTLRDLLREGKMAPERALAIVPPICDALQYAHEKGVVHRDVKPENILIDKEGRVKVADFGIARIVGIEVRDNLTGEGQMLGTAHYMAPEQASQPSEVDHRADIYAVGVVFYEMLTGELPLGRFPEPSKKVRIDVRLDEIVLKALEQEPERRYQQASEVRTAVTRVTETPAQPNASSRSAPPETRNQSGPWARRVFWIIATCFAVPIGLFLMSLIGYQLASLIGVRLTYEGITMIILVLAGIAFAMLLILRSLVRSFQRERTKKTSSLDS